MIGRIVRISVGCLAALALLAGTANAATVTNTNDSGPGSLRQAIAEAASGETISIPAGTYTLTSGELLILNKSLTLTGAGAASTTIRSNGSSRVLSIVGSANQVSVSGVTIRDGHTTIGSPSEAKGAGILSTGTDLTLRNDVIADNLADAAKAGAKGEAAIGAGVLFVGGTERQLVIGGTVISGNVARSNGASGFRGGTAIGAGMTISGGSFSIEGSAIEGNLSEARGGQGPSSPEQKGGGASGAGLLAASASASSSLRSSTIAGNVAEAGSGPGASGGEAAGGGVDIISAAPVSLAEITVSNNLARAEAGVAGGGGLLLISGSGKPTSVTSSTIASNVVEGTGAETGGGDVYGLTPLTFADTIVSGGVGPSGTQNCKFVGTPGEATTAGFNLDSLDQCGFHGPGDIVNRDPLLGPLQANGGPTQTMAPAFNSPVVDQGAALGLSTDQRGLPRPIDFPSIPNSSAPGADGTDIGAVELQPSTAISFGALKRNRKKETAQLTVNLPVPNVGTVSLSGRGVTPGTIRLSGATPSVTFTVSARGGARKALRRRGKRKVSVAVTYAPPSTTPVTITRVVKLVGKKKRHRHHRKHGHHGTGGGHHHRKSG